MDMMLDGIKVLDITNNLAGPGTAAVLAEHGAEVIHIEKPHMGDDCRFFTPMVGEKTSYSHCYINRCKKSVVMDLKDPEAYELLKKMIAETDIIIESNRPGVMTRLGLGYKTVSKIKPDIIYCSVSAFGQTGPYATRAGYDVIAQAYSGIMDITGEPDGSPTKIGTAIGDYVGLLNAFGSIMTALYHRERTGVGQHVDISLARGLLWMTANFDYKITGKEARRAGRFHNGLCPYGIFNRPSGGSIVIGAVNVKTWERLCQAMGREELISDPNYCTNDVRCARRDEVIAIIESWLDTQESVDKAAALLNEYGVPNNKVNSSKDLEKDPQALECKWIAPQPAPDSIREKYSETLNPYGLADFSAAGIRRGKAPDLGQHNHEVLTRYGLSDEDVDRLWDKWHGVRKQAAPAAN